MARPCFFRCPSMEGPSGEGENCTSDFTCRIYRAPTLPDPTKFSNLDLEGKKKKFCANFRLGPWEKRGSFPSKPISPTLGEIFLLPPPGVKIEPSLSLLSSLLPPFFRAEASCVERGRRSRRDRGRDRDKKLFPSLGNERKRGERGKDKRKPLKIKKKLFCLFFLLEIFLGGPLTS